MNATIENFLERPLSHKIGFWVVSLAIVIFIFWTYFYSGKLAEREELSQKVDSLNVEIANERRVARNLDKFRTEVKDLDVKLDTALKQLPDEKEIPDFLRSIEEKAREAGLQVVLFTQLPERIRNEFYAEVPVTISVEGSYHQVATFFDEVGRLPRIVNISDISLKMPQVSEDKVRIKADYTALIFRYLTETEREQMRRQKEESKKRKPR